MNTGRQITELKQKNNTQSINDIFMNIISTNSYSKFYEAEKKKKKRWNFRRFGGSSTNRLIRNRFVVGFNIEFFLRTH